MQPPQPPYQGPYPPPQPPQSTTAQKVTAWSAGMIALVIAGPIVLIVLCCVLDMVTGVLGSVFGGPLPTSTP